MLFAFLLTCLSAPTTVSLPADAGTTISYWKPDQPQPEQGQLRIRSSNARKALLRWSPEALRQLGHQKLVSAELRLYVSAGRNPEQRELTAHRVDTPWEPETATWNQPSGAQVWRTPGLGDGFDFDHDAAGHVLAPVSNENRLLLIPLELDLLREWIATPERQAGLVLKVVDPKQPGVDATFAGPNAADPAQRPVLVVVTEPGEPERFQPALKRRIEAETALPFYLNRNDAAIVLQAKPGRGPVPVELVATPRDGTRVLVRQAALVPPEGQARVSFDLRDWPDGEFLVTLTATDGPGELQRIIRKQTTSKPTAPAEPLALAGRKILFVDDYWLASSTGATFIVHPAETFPVTTGLLEPHRPQNRGMGLRISDDGSLEVRFRNMDRRGNDPRIYTARSRDGREWTLEREQQALGGVQLAAAEPTPTYRWYDAERDGPVVLGQVRVQYTDNERHPKWGELELPSRSTFPVWRKSPNEWLVLRREPLTQDHAYFRDDELGEWHNTNDNFGGQWLSQDGSTLCYCQGRTVPRHEPYRIDYDNLWTCNRLLVVWTTTNGIDWDHRFILPPTEADPPSWQHYGLHSFVAESGGVRLGFLFAYDQYRQQIRLDFVSSRDGLSWERYPGQPSLVANGPPASWNFGHCFPYGGSKVRHGRDEYCLIGYASNAPHFFHEFLYDQDDLSQVTPRWLQLRLGGRDLTSWPFQPIYNTWEKLDAAVQQASQTVGVMRYRIDGWVSLSPTEREAILTTKPLLLGDHLSLNAEVRDGGSLTVELLDAAGQAIPGYFGDGAATFTGDAIDAELRWGAGTKPPNQPVQLRIRLVDADLYAISG